LYRQDFILLKAFQVRCVKQYGKKKVSQSVYKPSVLAHCHELEELPIRFQKLQTIYNNKSQMLANLNHLNKMHAKSSLQRINTIEESRISQL
jgi:hypothetical protein